MDRSDEEGNLTSQSTVSGGEVELQEEEGDRSDIDEEDNYYEDEETLPTNTTGRNHNFQFTID